jgi:hypothetical protein
MAMYPIDLVLKIKPGHDSASYRFREDAFTNTSLERYAVTITKYLDGTYEFNAVFRYPNPQGVERINYADIDTVHGLIENIDSLRNRERFSDGSIVEITPRY